MDEPWHTSIAGDLVKVEKLMASSVRSKNQELTEICDYVLRSNGKRIRPSMCLLSYRACGGKDIKRAINLATAIEIIHNATLIHDDINDHGELRRGAQAAYKKYSIGQSIVAGDFLFATGYRLIGTAAPEVVDYIVSASAAMAAGEFDQKAYEHNIRVTEKDYMKIIEGKTARLIESGAKIGAFLSGSGSDTIQKVGEFALQTGLAFQIVDDMLDVIGTDEVIGKKTGSDIMEGKPTLPTIFAMQDPEYGGMIKDLFSKKELSWKEVGDAITLIKKTDAIQRCSEKAKKIALASHHYLDVLDDSVYKRSMIGLSNYFVQRNR